MTDLKFIVKRYNNLQGSISSINDNIMNCYKLDETNLFLYFFQPRDLVKISNLKNRTSQIFV